MLKSIARGKWARKLVDYLMNISLKRLSENQKDYLKSKLSLKQKEFIKRFVGEQKYIVRMQVEEYKYKLLNLGFHEKAIEDLKKLTLDDSNELAHREACWELALWYADHRTLESAEIALSFLNKSLINETGSHRLFQGVLLQAELYQMLGKGKQAEEIINSNNKSQKQGDLLLANANLKNDLPTKLQWINRLMLLHGLAEIDLEKEGRQSNFLFDRLKTVSKNKKNIFVTKKKPLVSIIMPVYNSETVIKTALDSLLSQTWTNIELIIVDDCSTDRTIEIIDEYIELDTRIKLIKAEVNSGTYVSRNLGLKVAMGEFVTCHDADDWSHAEKIERQVLHLIDNPKLVANVSDQSRLTNNLLFYRRKQQRLYVFSNMSSLMFRRQKVKEKIGYWDSVRFSGDGEFVRRMKREFGEASVANICSGPLSFTRVSEYSLTENGPFGYYGYFFGARKEYVESFDNYHKQAVNLRYEFPQIDRPFAIPNPMQPSMNRLEKPRHFDVIIASDFRLSGGTTSSNLEEIKAQIQAGLRTGLVQMSSYQAKVTKEINYKIREIIDGSQVQMLVYGEKITCDVLIVRHPPVLHEIQKYIPEVKAKRICVIVNQTPKVDYGGDGAVAYDIGRCQENLERYFAQTGVWYPIGPLVRNTLIKQHAKEIKEIHLAEEDWVNIINTDEWKQKKKLPIGHSEIRIGRHSRDQYVKWPSNPAELLQIYPDSAPYEIHVLGGAKIPESILGFLPKNWRVIDFGDMDPMRFLAGIDVFVYYIHPECIEAFGRVIIEAMAVGVPVILPPSYKDLFRDAAVYAEPEEVKVKINILISDSEIYASQIAKALNYISDFFDYSSHISRLKIGEE
ncbi:glycosyltransferase [Paenibacillus sp. ACRRY]|uniref:glycosyltransferase n=1 Tax=Paenibacillus sp. ACRRY TaxID=2918208 RepID=UPI001EF4CF94|nr:glycosyltransferase [Paenibacillus sp. ACRRY]MCG7384150.1 glycosyltransferase [Paenibacillus sp. ACRRY]